VCGSMSSPGCLIEKNVLWSGITVALDLPGCEQQCASEVFLGPGPEIPALRGHSASPVHHPDTSLGKQAITNYTSLNVSPRIAELVFPPWGQGG
jgi:hypothetical protein